MLNIEKDEIQTHWLDIKRAVIFWHIFASGCGGTLALMSFSWTWTTTEGFLKSSLSLGLLFTMVQ